MSDIDVFAQSRIIESRPIGPSLRRYANAAVLLASELDPVDMLQSLQAIEIHFGRIRRGQQWRARTLDLDILLWSEGMWVSENPLLTIPHPAMHGRSFVMGPASQIAPDWRDPVTGQSLKQIFHRLNRSKPLDRFGRRH